MDLSAAVACSSSSGGGSTSSLSAIGRSAPINSQATSPWRYATGSAPATPRATPPASPQHWPRRMRPSTPQHLPTSQLATVKSEASTPMT